MFQLSNSVLLSYGWGVGSSASATVNTTGTLAFDVTAACSSSNASNTISCMSATLEVLN